MGLKSLKSDHLSRKSLLPFQQQQHQSIVNGLSIIWPNIKKQISIRESSDTYFWNIPFFGM